MRYLTANRVWKVASLAIATLLWYLVVAEPELVTSQPAPIFLKNLPRDIEVASDIPDRVHLELRGPEGKLTAARLADTGVFLDLNAVEAPGERTFTIGPGSLNLPRGVTFLRAVPSQLRLRFDRLMSKEVAVQVRTTGSNVSVVRQEVQPKTLKVTGPENHVRQVEAAQTDPIDVSKVSKHGQFTVHAFVADPQVRFENAPVVTVNVWVERPDTSQQ